MRCLVCEKNTKEYIILENDFCLCKKCFDAVYPYLVKDYLLELKNLLHLKVLR